MLTEPDEPVDISDAELAKFWGADLTTLTPSQRMLVARLLKELKKRQGRNNDSAG